MSDDLADEFCKWDPMRDDYFNSAFNLYDNGPGAGLDPALQPAELAKQKALKVQPYLVFKNIPKNMTEKSLKLLCERHATVERLIENKKSATPNTLVFFQNISDMDAVHRALKDANYGFTVSIGRNMGQQNINNRDIDSEIGRSWSIPSSSRPQSDINIEDRKILISRKKPPRPKLSNTMQDEMKALNGRNSSISKNDPLQHCVKEIDSHELERAGIKIPDSKEHKEGDEYNYRTGRLYYNMPQKTKSFVEAKHQNSSGIYNTELEKYWNRMAGKKDPIVMRCVVCNTAADISCYRCGVNYYIYCGRECQNKDWENHRAICGKPKKSIQTSTTPHNANDFFERTPNKKQMPTPQTPQTPTSTTSSSSFSSPDNASTKSSSSTSKQQHFPIPEMPPPNTLVTLTAVNSPTMVFIRSKEHKENIKFFQIVNQLQEASKLLKPLNNLPSEGQAVIAKFEHNNEYGRALVLKVKDANNIRINFLDYGNVEIVKLSELYKIPNEFILLPRSAVPVILKDVPKCHMTNEIRSLLYTYLRDIDLIIKYSVDSENLTAENIYQVDLFDASTNQHLNKIIARICQPHQPINNDEIVTIEKLSYMPMPTGEDIELIILDNSQIHVGCISCTTKVYQLEIEGFQKDVQNYASSLEEQNYTPRQDELCLAKYSVDNLWYRGRCMEKVGDGKPLILFIDYGNLDYVSFTEIRPYPPEFNWPIFTVDFAIADLPEDENLSENLVKRLEELFPVGETLRADKVEHVEGNFYVLKMDGVLKTLADEKLLK